MFRLHDKVFALILLSTVGFAACSPGSTEAGSPRQELVFYSRNLSLRVGDTTTVGLTWLTSGVLSERTSATGTGPDWTSEPATTWSSRDSSIAAVSALGVVRANTSGATWVVAMRGDTRDSSSVIVTRSASTAENVTSVTSGVGHACALQHDGTAWCWGNLWNAAPGTGLRARYSRLVSPTRVATRERFVSIDAGNDHTCALSAEGAVWCWGDNRLGQTGSDQQFVSSPTRVPLAEAAVALSAGGDAACALLANGTARCWGSGYDMATTYSSGGATRFDALSVGSRHVCARSSLAELWCWGENSYGQLGTGDRLPRTRPTRVIVDAKVAQVSSGGDFTCLLDDQLRAWCWGTGSVGQLGQGAASVRLVPFQVPASVLFTRLSAGGGSVCALTGDGSAYCWGGNVYGALGIGPPTKPDPLAIDLIFPTAMKVLSSEAYRLIEVGAGAACAITRNESRLDCWGPNTNGQLGVGQTSWSVGRQYSQRDTPTAVVQFVPQ